MGNFVSFPSLCSASPHTIRLSDKVLQGLVTQFNKLVGKGTAAAGLEGDVDLRTVDVRKKDNLKITPQLIPAGTQFGTKSVACC